MCIRDREEDLARRDLTINSIAVHVDSTRARAEFDAEPLALAAHWHASGALVDPYGGIQDIADKALRHVTPAFRDDPVRILRLARFAARFTEFHVAPETQTLMREMVQTDEVDHLVAERVWQELARGPERQPPAPACRLRRIDSPGAWQAANGAPSSHRATSVRARSFGSARSKWVTSSRGCRARGGGYATAGPRARRSSAGTPARRSSRPRPGRKKAVFAFDPSCWQMGNPAQK